MRVYLGSDHAGLWLKGRIAEFLAQRSHEAFDLGAYIHDPEDDYPDYAARVCEKVLAEGAQGILICGTGQGMDRAANKFPGIDAAVCWDELSARVAREHGNVNILCMGARCVDESLAKKIILAWLEGAFSNEARHVRRIAKIREIEGGYLKKR